MIDEGVGVQLRRTTEADLDQCTRIWKRAIDDYEARLNQPLAPDDLSGLRRLLAHLLVTDPERSWVAVGDGDAPVGFAVAHVRGPQWFLAMLFVEPNRQAAGLGRRLLDGVLGEDRPVRIDGADPGPAAITRWATCTDSAQPISNALYATYGLVPRAPIWRLTGTLRRPELLGELPRSVVARPFGEVVATGSDGHRRLAGAVGGIDAAILGYERPADHAFLRREGRDGILFADRGGRPLGYAYASAIGRIGPVAGLEPALLPPLVRHVASAIPVSGDCAIWVPGPTDGVFAALVRAGFRLEGFPGLVCATDADLPFERYVPISLALL